MEMETKGGDVAIFYLENFNGARVEVISTNLQNALMLVNWHMDEVLHKHITPIEAYKISHVESKDVLRAEHMPCYAV